MRREDARYRYFFRRLQAFTGVYQRTAWAWVDTFMRTPNVGAWMGSSHDVAYAEILHQIEGFDDLVRLCHPFACGEPAAHIRGWRMKFLAPLHAQIDAHIAPRWRAAWREQHLDFAQVPTAPAFSYEALRQVTKRTWVYGTQFSISFVGTKQDRRCQIATLSGSKLIWAFAVPPVPLSEGMPLVLPRVRRLAALTDWSQAEQLPDAARRALQLRSHQVESFYHNRSFQVQPLPLPQKSAHA